LNIQEIIRFVVLNEILVRLGSGWLLAWGRDPINSRWTKSSPTLHMFLRSQFMLYSRD